MTKSKSLGVPLNQFACTKAVLRLTTLRSRQKMVLVALSDHYGTVGDAFPSQGKLARQCGLSVKTVQRALKDLERKQYVRRQVRQRPGFRTRSCVFALIIAEGESTGHHVQAIRHCVPNNPVTVTELNKPSEHTKEQAHLWIRCVEDYLLQTFESVIDFGETPRLISLAVVSRWLFNGHKLERFAKALEHLLQTSEQMRLEYQRAGRVLSSWKELLDRLNTHEIDQPTKPDIDFQDAPLMNEFKAVLPVALKSDMKFAYELGMIAIKRDGSSLVLTSQSKRAIDQLMERALPYLRKFGRANDGDIKIYHNRILIETITP